MADSAAPVATDSAAPALADSAVPTAANTAAPEQRRAGYIVRHWRGDLSLGISYWLNGVLLGNVVGLAVLGLNEAIATASSLRLIAAVCLSAIVFALIVHVWTIVGVWRSAGKHRARGGRAFWAGAARVAVAVGAVVTALRLNAQLGPGASELRLIALGLDPLGSVQIRLSRDGKVIHVSGFLREGSSRTVRDLLKAAPGVSMMALNSPGGRLHEAKEIARLVRARRLDTYVQTECDSACTIVLLAGQVRAADPSARIGFHQPSFAGMTRAGQEEFTEEVLTIYREDGIPQAFLDHVKSTDSNDMWYPTREELIAANVITRASGAREAAARVQGAPPPSD